MEDLTGKNGQPWWMQESWEEEQKYKKIHNPKRVSWNALYSAGELTRLLSDYLFRGQLPQSREKRQLATIRWKQISQLL